MYARQMSSSVLRPASPTVHHTDRSVSIETSSLLMYIYNSACITYLSGITKPTHNWNQPSITKPTHNWNLPNITKPTHDWNLTSITKPTQKWNLTTNTFAIMVCLMTQTVLYFVLTIKATVLYLKLQYEIYLTKEKRGLVYTNLF